MKNSIIVLALLCSFNLLSQCKVDYDRFEQVYTIGSDFVEIGKMPRKNLLTVPFFIKAKIECDYGEKEKRKAYFLHIIPEFEAIQTIRKGTPLYIEFENNEVWKLEIEEL